MQEYGKYSLVKRTPCKLELLIDKQIGCNKDKISPVCSQCVPANPGAQSHRYEFSSKSGIQFPLFLHGPLSQRD